MGVLALALPTLQGPVAADEPACTITWDGSENSAWQEPLNWDAERIPTGDGTDHVCIPGPTASPVVYNDPAPPFWKLASLHSSVSITIEEGNLSAGRSSRVLGDVVIGVDARLSGITVDGSVTNYGTFAGEIFGPSHATPVDMVLDNHGVAYVGGGTSGSGDAGVHNHATAELVMSGAFFATGPVVNEGTVKVSELGHVTVEGDHPITLGTWALQGGEVAVVPGTLYRTLHSGTFNGWGRVTLAAVDMSGEFKIDERIAVHLWSGVSFVADTAISGGGTVEWEDAVVMPDTTLTLGSETTTTVFGDWSMEVPETATLRVQGRLEFDRGSAEFIRGHGTIDLTGTMTNVGGWGGHILQVTPTLVSSGVIDWDHAVLHARDLRNEGLIKLGRPVLTMLSAGSFTQTADGRIEVIVDAALTNCHGDAQLWGCGGQLEFWEANLAGTIDVAATNGCVASWQILLVHDAIQGSAALGSSPEACAYALTSNDDGAMLRSNEVTPPSLPTYNYGSSADTWTTAETIPGGIKPQFDLSPAQTTEASDEATGVREVITWWDANADSDHTAAAGDLYRSGEATGEYLAAPAGTAHFWRHIAARDWAGNWAVRHDGPFKIDMQAPTPATPTYDAPPDLMHVKDATFRVTWPASSDAGAGLGSPAYTVRAGGNETSTDTTSHDFVPSGQTCVSVETHDAVGLTSSGDTRCVAAPISWKSFARSAGWQEQLHAENYYGTAVATKLRAATLSRTATAQRYWLVATKCGSCGVVEVHFKGVLRQRVKLASATFSRKVMIPLRSLDGLGRGKLKLRVSSSGKLVRVHAITLLK